MHRHEFLRARLQMTGCTVCGAVVDPERVRILAERDDMAFLELPCDGCGSVALGIVTVLPGGDAELDPPWSDESGVVGGASSRGASSRVAPPVGVAEVREMARFLAGYQGDLRSLLEPPPASPDAGAGAAP